MSSGSTSPLSLAAFGVCARRDASTGRHGMLAPRFARVRRCPQRDRTRPDRSRAMRNAMASNPAREGHRKSFWSAELVGTKRRSDSEPLGENAVGRPLPIAAPSRPPAPGRAGVVLLVESPLPRPPLSRY